MGENQIFSGTTRNSHFSGEILLVGNHCHFYGERGREKLLLERVESTLYSIYYNQISGGETTISVGDNQLYRVFSRPGIPIFRGGILVAENHSRFSAGKEGKMGI